MVEAPGTLHAPRPGGIAHRLRILQVIVLAEFKLKYAGSALGYVWSVVKPLTLFTVLYLVFTRIFKLGSVSEFYAVSLLVGIVFFSFFSDATNQGMVSLVHRESLLRRMRFPRMLIPTAATLTAAMTFGVNLVVVVAFIAWERIEPQLDWVLLIPLLVELYVFILGTALVLATLFISFRDMGQVWELAAQLMFYASPIIYPAALLPQWAQEIVFLNPFVQILQDVRALVLYDDLPANNVTAPDVLGEFGRLIPVGIALAVFGLGVALFKRYEPWFAERA
ncbi:MAG: ABC transporter permease [Chloroflexi bacterium]|nr:ABC transporter permease [Chloroflexota bacterium]